MLPLTAAGLLLLSLTSAFLVASAAAPPNDAFANRIPLTGSNLFVTGTITGATAEPDDPQIEEWTFNWQGTKQSVWWTWTAPARGTLTIDPSASAIGRKAIIALQGNSLATTTNLGFALNDAILRFNVQSRETYHFAVLTDTTSAGELRLTLAFDPSPPHDQFADRAILTGKQFTFSGSLRGATDDFGHPQSHDIWAEWTAPVSGRLRVVTLSGVGAATYKGSSLLELEPLTSNEVNQGDRVIFRISGPPTVTGAYLSGEVDTTHVVIDPPIVTSPNTATIKLIPDPDYPQPTNVVMLGTNLFAPPWELTFRPIADNRPVRVTATYPQFRYEEFSVIPQVRAPNDHFANAAIIPSAGGTNHFDTLRVATLEPGEPKHYSEARATDGSLWWRYQAPADGHLWVRAYYTGLAVYRGDSLDSLTRIDRLPAQTEFYPVRRGATYHIAVQDRRNLYPEYTLAVAFLPLIGNDDFAQPQQLPINGALPAHLSGATSEAGEPGNVPSLWYEWTAPNDGEVRFQLIFPDQILRAIQYSAAEIAVYSGTSLANLVRIDQPFEVENPFRKTVTAGEHLFIQIRKGSFAEELGDFLLKTTFHPAPTNDLFAQRTVIQSVPYTSSYNSRWTYKSDIGESRLIEGNHSQTAWWEWTAPSDMLVSITPQRGDPFYYPLPAKPSAYVRVFQGNNMESLQPVTTQTNIQGEVLLNATGGQNYKIGVFATSGTEVDLVLSPALPNDDFADAAPLSKEADSIYFSTLGATFEPGENTNIVVELDTYPTLGNLWWRFVAPTNGYLKNVAGVLQLYTGDSRDTLAPVHSYESPSLGQNNPGFSWFPVEQGESYYFDIRKIFSPALEPPSEFAHYLSYDFATFQIAGLTNGAILNPDTSTTVTIAPPHPVYDGVPFGNAALRVSRIDQWGSTPQVTQIAAFPFTAHLNDLNPGNYSIYALAVTTNGDTIRTPEIRFAVRSTNDFFVQRTRFEAIESGSLAGATLEPGEETLFTNDVTGSIWFEWLARSSENIRINAYNHPHFARVAVFSGSAHNALQPIAHGSGSINFPATAGTAYQIAFLTTPTNPASATSISVEIQRPPTNDFFVAATIISSYPVNEVIHADVKLLSVEPGEPLDNSALGTAWWKFVPDYSGTLQISGFPKEWEIFSGQTLATLQKVPFDTNISNPSVEVQASTTYYLRVSRLNEQETAGHISLNFRPAFANDDFADATPVTGSFEFDIPWVFASIEPGEPAPASGPIRGSLWWKWQPTITGDINGSVPQEWSLDLFTGTSLISLQRVQPLSGPAHVDTRSFYSWAVDSSRSYYVRVALPNERPTRSGTVSLVEPQVWPVPNADFATRLTLTGTHLDLSGTTAGIGFGSLWWTWKAPRAGVLRVWNAPDTILQTFRGDDPANLTTLSTGPAAIPVNSGDEIHIAARGSHPGPFEWHLEFVEPAPNTEREAALEIMPDGAAILADFTRSDVPRNPDGAWGSEWLWWKWTAPLGGQALIVSADPSLEPAFERAQFWFADEGHNAANVVAGRTYYIVGYGNKVSEFRLLFQPTPIAMELEPGDDLLLLHLNAPQGTIFILESSDDLLDWSPVSTLHLESPATLSLPSSGTTQFFRAIPLN